MPKHNFHFLEFKETKKLFKIFNDNFIEARFVGGCVRDAFLGIESDDFDIAVNKNIFELMDILKKSEIKCIPTGLKYGSITAILNGIKFEILSLLSSSKPIVSTNSIYGAPNGGLQIS